jgi:hypothetical protein
MITKPEDVNPYKKFDSTWSEPTLYVTLAECAQIARAYHKAKTGMKKFRKVDVSANQEPYPDDAWELEFKAWESL